MKCKYCNTETDSQFCSDECEQAYIEDNGQFGVGA